MAKGDDKRARNRIEEQGGLAQNNLNNTREGMVQPVFNNAFNDWRNASNESGNDYRNIMNQYQNFQTTGLQPVTADKVTYNRTPEMEESFGNYRNFANTGGFSDTDLGAMRARGISPIRSVYSNAQNELGRQRALQGNYSPNFGAVTKRMTGSLAQQIADQVQNVNAGIAEMVQKGKMFGTEGLGGLSVQDLSFGQQAQLANQAANLRAGEINRTTTDPMRLAAIEGQARLFGTAPGMEESRARTTLGALDAAGNLQGQQNQLSLGSMNAQIQAGQLPGRWDSTIGRIGQIANIGAGIAAPFFGSGMGLLGSNRILGANNTYNQFPGARQNSPY